jgi:anti-sigma regulatory factor (Ser/Thr protein kinase)
MQPPAPAAATVRTIANTYPGRIDQARQVRADLRPILDGCPIADDVIICASELAANAARHSLSREPGGTFTVRVEVNPGAYVRIEVEDDGGPWIEPPPDPARGRGLDIIRALAFDWGTYTDVDQRIVGACLAWPACT